MWPAGAHAQYGAPPPPYPGQQQAAYGQDPYAVYGAPPPAAPQAYGKRLWLMAWMEFGQL